MHTYSLMFRIVQLLRLQTCQPPDTSKLTASRFFHSSITTCCADSIAVGIPVLQNDSIRGFSCDVFCYLVGVLVNLSNLMTSVDHMDIPDVVASETVRASEAADDTGRPAKRSKSGKDGRPEFCSRIRDATGWCTTMKDGMWKNCTTDKSRRTFFVLWTPDGKCDQFCAVGKVFRSRLSREELLQPLPYDTSDEHTELSLSLGLRPAGDNDYWTNYDDDVEAVAESFKSLRGQAIDDVFAPLLATKPDKMPGIPDSRLKRGFGKSKKEIAASLDSVWGGTGMNGEGDIVNFKRKCYSTSIDDLSRPETRSKWLSLVDGRGDAINYIDQSQPLRAGDTVLVWYRVIAQACAGNFHVSIETRQIMRLGRGADGMAKGSAGLAAALAAAMERDDDDEV